jgi:hypothetical protein
MSFLDIAVVAIIVAGFAAFGVTLRWLSLPTWPGKLRPTARQDRTPKGSMKLIPIKWRPSLRADRQSAAGHPAERVEGGFDHGTGRSAGHQRAATTDPYAPFPGTASGWSSRRIAAVRARLLHLPITRLRRFVEQRRRLFQIRPPRPRAGAAAPSVDRN